jgi:hypothetical protein
MKRKGDNQIGVRLTNLHSANSLFFISLSPLGLCLLTKRLLVRFEAGPALLLLLMTVFPDDVWEIVLGHLSFRSLVRFGQGCQLFHQLSQIDRVRRKVIFSEYPELALRGGLSRDAVSLTHALRDAYLRDRTWMNSEFVSLRIAPTKETVSTCAIGDQLIAIITGCNTVSAQPMNTATPVVYRMASNPHASVTLDLHFYQIAVAGFNVFLVDMKAGLLMWNVLCVAMDHRIHVPHSSDTVVCL